VADSPHLFSRIIGALLAAGGGYAALTLGNWGLEQPVVIGIAAALGLVGFLFGAKVWEAIVHLF